MLALTAIVAWAATGPVFHYSDTWQLVINTSTTIVTFLMVFLIQRAQNKASLAVQLKLNELVAAIDAASNRLISIEDFSEEELEVLHRHYRELAEMAKKEAPLTATHSIEQAGARHHRKKRFRQRPQAE
jgi:low affinity Fe/Cu permease